MVQWVWAHGDDSLLDTVARVDLVTAGLFRGRMRRLPVTMMAVRAMTMVMVMAVMRCVVERREIEASRKQLPGDCRGTAPQAETSPGLIQMAPPVKQEQEDGETKKAGEDRPPQGHGRGEEWWRREGEDMDNEGLGFGVGWWVWHRWK